LEEIEHRTARVRRPQSNSIVEQLHRTLLDEYFRVEGRRTWFETIEEMQTVLDSYLDGYNHRRPYQGRGVNGRTPVVAFVDGLPKPNQQKQEKRPDRKASQISRLTPPAHRGTVSRLPSLYNPLRRPLEPARIVGACAPLRTGNNATSDE
jgi:hypothetical protein